MQSERFLLRLLLTYAQGLESFEYLRNFAGIIHPTFGKAYMALGFLEDVGNE